MAYVDLTARFIYELQTVFGDFSKLANNDEFVRAHGWQDGTVGVFFQAVAPTGWTRVTTVNGRGLRVVSGSGGGVGGVDDPGLSITLAHTHSVSTDSDHSHVLQAHTAYLATSGSEKANGTAVVPIMASTGATFNYPAGALGGRTVSGSVSEHTKKNELPMSGGPYSTDAAGTHTHGGATNSQLTSITLAFLNVLFCTKNTSTGYTDLTSTFVHNTRHVFDYLDECAENDAFNYARRTPAGTVSLFASATAPVGWTRDTSSHGKILRVVSDTGGGSGATYDIATTITLAHDHGSLTSGGGHSHTMPDHTHELADLNQTFAVQITSLQAPATLLRRITGGITNPTVEASFTTSGGAGASSTDGAHQHATGSALSDISLAYFNVIQASKDSAGAPTSYTDITTFFLDQAVLAYQDLQTMANNDAYLYFHTMPATSVMFFFQSSAPLNWTKLTTKNDAFLRIVSDATGGQSGGTAPISAGITLAHTHTLDSKSHTHTRDHTHGLNTVNATGVPGGTLVVSTRVFGAHGAEMYTDTLGGAGDTALGDTTETVTGTTDSVAHTHGGATGSALANVSLAYADVIQCSKN